MIYPFNTKSCFKISAICPPRCNNTTYLLDAVCLLAGCKSGNNSLRELWMFFSFCTLCNVTFQLFWQFGLDLKDETHLSAPHPINHEKGKCSIKPLAAQSIIFCSLPLTKQVEHKCHLICKADPSGIPLGFYLGLWWFLMLPRVTDCNQPDRTARFPSDRIIYTLCWCCDCHFDVGTPSTNQGTEAPLIHY